MKTLIVLAIFLSLTFALKLTNKNELKVEKKKQNVQLIFSQIYKHRFDSL